ncbi:hypothetical protein Tco_0633581 [Tanacetum coccineum]
MVRARLNISISTQFICGLISLLWLEPYGECVCKTLDIIPKDKAELTGRANLLPTSSATQSRYTGQSFSQWSPNLPYRVHASSLAGAPSKQLRVDELGDINLRLLRTSSATDITILLFASMERLD